MTDYMTSDFVFLKHKQILKAYLKASVVAATKNCPKFDFDWTNVFSNYEKEMAIKETTNLAFDSIWEDYIPTKCAGEALLRPLLHEEPKGINMTQSKILNVEIAWKKIRVVDGIWTHDTSWSRWML